MNGAANSGSFVDLTNLGLSADAHRILKRLKDDGVFHDMVDGYRLGFSVAVSLRAQPGPIEDRQTVFGVATADREGKLRSAVEFLYDTSEVTAYRWVERLADWGVIELGRRYDGDSSINIEEIAAGAE